MSVIPSVVAHSILTSAQVKSFFLGTRSKYQRSEYLQYHCPHSQAMSSGISEADALSLLKQLEQKYEALGLLEKAETEAFQKQLLDVAMLSLEKSLKSVTTSLIERQDSLEQKTGNRMKSLYEQISALSLELNRSSSSPRTHASQPTSVSTCYENLFHTSCEDPFLGEPDSIRATESPIPALNPAPEVRLLSCNLCRKSFKDIST